VSGVEHYDACNLPLRGSGSEYRLYTIDLSQKMRPNIFWCDQMQTKGVISTVSIDRVCGPKGEEIELSGGPPRPPGERLRMRSLSISWTVYISTV
jgi:hypothetical protein